MIEAVRDFWNARPCNIRHSGADIGTSRYFIEVSLRKIFVEPHIMQFADFPCWRDKKVLEVGCGIGTIGAMFAANGSYYTGVDLSDRSVRLAQHRFSLFNLKGRLVTGNAEEELEAIAEGEKYDLVYSFGVIHHSPNPEKIIASVKKLMKDSSEFRLMLYSKYSWKNLMIWLGLDQPEAQSGCPIAKVYSFREVRRLLSDFEIISISKDHIFKWDVETYKQYDYKEVWWFTWMPDWLFSWLEKRLGWHTLITCRLKNGTV